MTTINLLPWRENARRLQKRKFILLCGGVVLIALLINGLWHHLLQQAIDRQTQRNTLLQQEEDTNQKSIKNKKTFNEEKAAILNQMTTLQNVHNQHDRVIELLEVLPKLLPNDAFINTIQINDQVIELQGEAQSDSQVSDVIKRFNQQKGWQDIQLKEISTIKQSNRTAFKVTLSIQ